MSVATIAAGSEAAGSAGAARAAAGSGSSGAAAGARGGPAASGARASRGGRVPGRPQPSRSRTGQSGRAPKHKAPPQKGAAAQQWLQRQPPPTVQLVPEDTGRYRRIIIAEFAATVVIIGASPFLTPRKAGESPAEAAARFSLAAPLVRLSAACIVFFVLALMSHGAKTGRIAAAFGGLITLGALFNATTALDGLSLIFSSTPTTPPPPAAPTTPSDLGVWA